MTTPNDAPATAPTVLTLDAARPARGGLRVSTELRAGSILTIVSTITQDRMKTADKNAQQMMDYIRS